MSRWVRLLKAAGAIGSSIHNGQARLWVRDNGPGLPPDEHELIFQRFARGASGERLQGAGLGPAIVRAIAQAHHGNVELTSQPGAGATFTLVLPPTTHHRRRVTMSRILIAEDEARIATFLDNGLRANGFAADIATNGTEALRLARTDRYELPILDIGLLDSDGFEVLRTLRGEGSPLPIIILTARDSVHDILPPAGDAALDLRTRQVHIDGHAIDLSAREFALAETFFRHPGQILTRPNATVSDESAIRSRRGKPALSDGISVAARRGSGKAGWVAARLQRAQSRSSPRCAAKQPRPGRARARAHEPEHARVAAVASQRAGDLLLRVAQAPAGTRVYPNARELIENALALYACADTLDQARVASGLDVHGIILLYLSDFMAARDTLQRALATSQASTVPSTAR